ncbi:MAG: CBS domain-containing protein, partial [Anaerolineae bacterium]
MLVKDYMTRHPFVAEPSMSIVEAQRLMGENNIRHLPVVGEGKRLLGLVTRSSLLVDPRRLSSLDVWEIARYLSGLTVRDVMIKARDVITIHPDATIEDAARIMVERKV